MLTAPHKSILSCHCELPGDTEAALRHAAPRHTTPIQAPSLPRARETLHVAHSRQRQGVGVGVDPTDHTGGAGGAVIRASIMTRRRPLAAIEAAAAAAAALEMIEIGRHSEAGCSCCSSCSRATLLAMLRPPPPPHRMIPVANTPHAACLALKVS